VESFQYFFDVVLMLCDVIGVDQNVIQINYYAYIKEVGENIVHEVLKDSWSIG